MIILLAQKIKLNDFKVERRDIDIGYVTSLLDDKKTPIHDYIVVRTNYVGACYEEEGKNNPDCMNVISIDINNRIVLNELADIFDGNVINLYINGTPYDFLFTNKSCNDIDIKERGDEIKPAFGEKPCLRGSVKPPLVSLYFTITDLITLLTPRDLNTLPKENENENEEKERVFISDNLAALEVVGDLDRRIETKKHKKDINRYEGFMKIFIYPSYTKDTTEHTLKRIIQLLQILRQIKPQIDLIDPNIGTENLDKKCDSTSISAPCNQLKQELISFWDIFIKREHFGNYEINFGEYNKHSLKLRKILDMEPPGAKKTVTISP